MKNSMALLAMAASFGPATATFNFGSNWQNAGSFTCPGNSNNECKDEYKGGFDWSDLTTGSFSSYNGFNFNGWSCGESASWGKRTGGSKVIKASCGKESTPSFGCGSNSGVDKFTVSHFDIDVEFDCRLEFHYKMPGGSTCKQSSSCKKGGNKISNSQCGGATDVEIHWPVQDSPKPSCEIQIPSIGFDCGDHTPSKTTSVPVVSKTKTHPGGGHGTTSTAVVPSKSHPGGPESSSVIPSKSHPGGPESSSVVPSKSHPGSSVPTKSHPETTPIPSNTGSSVIPSQSSPATTPGGPETTSAPVPSTSEGNSPSSSEESSSSTTEENGPSTTGENSPSTTGNNSPSSPSETQSVPETTITTTWDSTSTIFTTTIKTITSCGPEIPDCPASGTPSTPIIVTETVPVTTTVCPVTETIVPSHTSGNSPVQSSKPPLPALPLPALFPLLLTLLATPPSRPRLLTLLFLAPMSFPSVSTLGSTLLSSAPTTWMLLASAPTPTSLRRPSSVSTLTVEATTSLPRLLLSSRACAPATLARTLLSSLALIPSPTSSPSLELPLSLFPTPLS
uniref:Uncharacterized protein n=1 Tax=Bionectria ochroleuca TaxID=29856 RepID=A0A8H7TUY2_BIOOC